MSCIYVDLELSHDAVITYDLGIKHHIESHKNRLEAPFVSKLDRHRAVAEVRSALNRWAYQNL